MHPNHYTINATDLYLYAATVLQAQLRWRDYGPKCTAIRLLGVLFYAAAQLVSVCAACNRLREAPTDQAVRAALVALCPEPAVLERQFNRSFAEHLPKALRKCTSPLAIDVVLPPYHGQPHQRLEEIYRSQAKSGTTHFHAYATCYVVHKGRRFTVALRRVEQGTSMVTVLKQLLRTARNTGVRLRLLWLDRSFYSVEVIRYLQAARYPFLMPVICRGRKPSDPRGPTSTSVFAAQKHAGRASYMLRHDTHQTVTVQVCVHCRNWQGRRGRQGRQTWVYAYWGITPKTTDWVYQTYRLRFGIETSYRQLHQARIPTTTRLPTLRLLFVGIALFLRNLWVWVHWHQLATSRRGGRILNLHLLPFETLLMWLAHVVELTFGFNDSVVIHHLN